MSKKPPSYATLAERNKIQADIIETQMEEINALRRGLDKAEADVRIYSEAGDRANKALLAMTEKHRIANFDTQTAERRAEELHEHLVTALSACKAWQLLYEHMRERDANR